jgi:zinc transporter
MSNDHVLHIYEFDGAGNAQRLDGTDELDFNNPTGGYLWLHLCAMHEDTRAYLESRCALDHIVIDAMLATETRPRALVRKNGTLIIFRAMNLTPGQEPEDMISIRIWIDDKNVITTRKRDIKAIEDIIESIDRRDAPKSAADFLIMITDRVFDRMEPFLVDLEDRISRTEELLASSDQDDLVEDAAFIRKRTAIFKRYIAPQKAVLETLLKSELGWLDNHHRESLAESLDTVTRYVEELQELRDRSQIINDELNNLHARRQNEITYIFSVAATIFLPLGFLTGLMGINLGGMPWANDNAAFWVFSGLCGLIAVVQITLFRKIGWF